MQPIWNSLWYLLLIVITLPILLYLRPRKLQSCFRREHALYDIAKKHGFSFYTSVESNNLLLKILEDSALYSHGDDGQVAMSILQSTADVDIFIFDFHYARGFGQRRKNYKQTVLLFHSNRLLLPSFILLPRTVTKMLLSLVGNKYINIPDNSVFSKKYLLKGSQEEHIKNIFNSNLLRLLE